MCGIFGFITKNGSGPDLAAIRRIAAQTEHRGRHAFGLAWLAADGVIHAAKRPGPATANLGDVDACRDATAVIGHCRWATHGDPADNRNNHPHRAGRGWIVHNGVVANYERLAGRYNLPIQSECDSEVLGLLMARMRGELALRAAKTAELAVGPLAMLGLWRRPTRLLLVKNGNPLFCAGTSHGLYFASQPTGLPGTPTTIRERYAGTLTLDAGRLLHDAYEIECGDISREIYRSL
jgi:glucosamine--fructose-6-phosphate aminotransferase (isomerizing)